jgi:hypothetical protein
MKRKWIALGLAAALLMPVIQVHAGEAVTEDAAEAVTETVSETVSEAETDPAVNEPEELYRLRYAMDYKEVYDAVKNASYYYRYDYEPLIDYETTDAVMEQSAEMATGTATVSLPDTGLSVPVPSFVKLISSSEIISFFH